MNTRFWALFLPSILFYACNPKPSVISDVYINSFSEESNSSLFEDVFSDIRVVPLYLGEHVLGSTMALHVERAEGGYLITDHQTNSIYYLDHHGSLITYLSKVGRGPGEYNYLQYCKYKDHRLIALADGTHIIEYTENGALVKEAFLEEDIMDFFPLDGQEYALFLYRYNGESDLEDRVVITDSSFVKKRSYLPMTYQLFNYGSYISSVTGDESLFLCIQQSRPELYKCDKDTVVTTYHYDFNGKEYPKAMLEVDDYEPMLDILTGTPDIYGIVNVFENQDYLFQAISHLVDGEENRIGQWMIDKRDMSSSIEYWDLDSPEFQFFGPPQMLTENNEVVYICDLSLIDNVKDMIPGLTKIEQENKGKVTDAMLLFCKIGE